eukprot:CAMPEP_0181185442 /NCGR_PEP_ID=MMETSP1096-20121128/9506_1 /TAXON_ID=156174 ORGANISM="Chrysochromulina ericina, Strain CCMP281" /NCGR_SAMPLE_ID=MMETSP1096 /ASSEMBLY_ACC=CAM_ASM_000453 /LENGTH=334 /DNA_ID=CAMNT_0023274279 /DNA_START=124 /DNA_END=1129 /DNA_ORIENTATION=+
MDEVEANMMMTTNTNQMTAEDAAMAASHTQQPELSPTRVARADPDQSASAEKPRKLRRACPIDEDSDDDAAMAATDSGILPNIADTAVDEETRHLLLHSRKARLQQSAMQRMMADAGVAALPTLMPPGQSMLGTAADALAAAIHARPGEVAVRSSPPRGHIRMAPHLQPAAEAGAWQVWEKRGSTSASTSTNTSAPPSPQRAEAPGGAGIATANRLEAISEEPRVTPFSSQELRGTWAKFERTMGDHGMSDAALVEHAMKSMSFRERVLATAFRNLCEHALLLQPAPSLSYRRSRKRERKLMRTPESAADEEWRTLSEEEARRALERALQRIVH